MHNITAASGQEDALNIATQLPADAVGRIAQSRLPPFPIVAHAVLRVMIPRIEPFADIAFAGEVINWRGPAPFFFVAVPAEHVAEVRHAARLASYGWGVVPVEAVVGGARFRTSLFPKDDGYLLPLRAAVRKAAMIDLGDVVRAQIRVTANDLSEARPIRTATS